MRLTKFLVAAAAVSLAATPAVSATANPAAKLSLASQAAAGTAEAEEPRRKLNSGYMLAGVGVLVVILAALAMGGSGSDSKPASA